MNNSDWKVSQLLALGFGPIFLVVIAMAFYTSVTMDSTNESLALNRQAKDMEAAIRHVEKLLIDAETGQRGYLYTGNPDYLEPYNASRRDFRADISIIRANAGDNPAQLQRILEIEALAQQKYDELAETIRLYGEGNKDEAFELVTSDVGKLYMDQIREISEEAIAGLNQQLASDRQALDQSIEFTREIVVGGSIAVVVIGLVVAIFISRRIMNPIREVAQSISAAAKEMSATTEQHERTSALQSSAVTETTTTMAELDKTSLQTAEQAESASSKATDVRELSHNGAEEIRKAQEAITELRTKVDSISSSILRLSEQTNLIQEITHLVSDLANQTNLLALNASVEAARAGDHGKGFAVVAGEIRKLSDESKKSAERIQSVVSEIQTSTNRTVMVTEEGTQHLMEVTRISESNSQVLEEIAGASEVAADNTSLILLNAKQQAVAVNQVLESMNELARGASETATGIAQTRTGLEDIESAANRLTGMV